METINLIKDTGLLGKKHIIMLAANATEPPMDGGAQRSLAFREQFVRHGISTIWLGRTRSSLPSFPQISAPRSKMLAAFRSVLKRSNYVGERHVGSDWRRAAATAAVASTAETIIWGNFIWSYAEWRCAGGRGRFFLDTHNSEREWFENISRSTKNPIIRRVADVSIRCSEAAARNLPDSVTCVHVSERDLDYYRALAPQCRHAVVPNGCDIKPPRQLPRKVGLPRLYFLGSLGVQMNNDALRNFEKNFWPSLNGRCSFQVFGSNPTAEVIALCQNCGWQLKANLTDKELDLELAHMDIAVMPFAYTAGSKLKLLDALSRGMLVLTTLEGVRGLSGLPESVVSASTGREWADILQKVELDSPHNFNASIAYARKHTWTSIIGSFLSGHLSPLKP